MKVDACYAELIASLRQHIAEVYPPASWLGCEAENFTYFKNSALQAKAGKKAPVAHPPAAKPASDKPLLVPADADINPVKVAVNQVDRDLSNHKPPSLEEVEPLASQETSTTAKVIGTSQKPTPKTPEAAFKRTALTLEKISAPVGEEFGDLQKLWREKFPHLALIETIPPDDGAKEIALQWQVLSQIPEVVVLSFNETVREKCFLKNLTLAVQHNLAPACIIPIAALEGGNGWQSLLHAPSLKLLIANHGGLSTLPRFAKQFLEEPGGKNYWGKIPLHLLADLSLYMTEPHLKVTLWRNLCQLLRRR